MKKFVDLSFYGRENEELQKEWERTFPNMTLEDGKKALREIVNKANEIHDLSVSANEKMEDLNRNVEKINKIWSKYNF